MSMGSHLVDGGEHSRGKTLHWVMLILGDHKEGVCVCMGGLSCRGVHYHVERELWPDAERNRMVVGGQPCCQCPCQGG